VRITHEYEGPTCTYLLNSRYIPISYESASYSSAVAVYNHFILRLFWLLKGSSILVTGSVFQLPISDGFQCIKETIVCSFVNMNNVIVLSDAYLLRTNMDLFSHRRIKKYVLIYMAYFPKAIKL
jgi:hypothetical protein